MSPSLRGILFHNYHYNCSFVIIIKFKVKGLYVQEVVYIRTLPEPVPNRYWTGTGRY